MPLIRDYPQADSLIGTDAFVIDRVGVGTMYVEADALGEGTLSVEEEGTPVTTATSVINFVGSGVTATGDGTTATVTIPGGPSTGAFRTSLYDTLTVPIGNGYSGNGGYALTFDTPVFDLATGVVLALDYASLPAVAPGVAFYSPSTAYVIPTGMAGIWSFSLQVFLSSVGVDQNNVFAVGFTHLRADGAFVDTDDPSGSQIQTSQQANLAPATGAFDNGQSFSIIPVLYDCLEGDIILPFILRSPTTSTLDIAGFSTFFQGFRVSA